MAWETSEILKVLSVETRLKIIELLKHKKDMCVNEIAKSFNMTQSAVSQHLKILKHAGFVSSNKKGYWIHYSLNEDALQNCVNTVQNTCCCYDKDNSIENINHQKIYDLNFLKKHKIELEKELNRVNNKIKELENKK